MQDTEILNKAEYMNSQYGPKKSGQPWRYKDVVEASRRMRQTMLREAEKAAMKEHRCVRCLSLMEEGEHPKGENICYTCINELAEEAKDEY